MESKSVHGISIMKAWRVFRLWLAFMPASPLHAQLPDYMDPERPLTPEIRNLWQIQGEYSGVIEGGAKLGAWVVAYGDHFDVVFLPGGLVSIPGQPGGGWGGVLKYRGTGTKPEFTTANGYKAAVTGSDTNRVLAGATQDGKKFSLRRITRHSPTLGLAPRPDWGATFLFRKGQSADLANWLPNPGAPRMRYGGYLYKGVLTSVKHGDIFLHAEILQSFCPTCIGQLRGNSGIYYQNGYETQILDSFGLNGENNEMGAIYGTTRPLINACLPPLQWQTYDVYFRRATPTSPVTITAYLNGVLVQNKTAVGAPTEAGTPVDKLALNFMGLQDHNNEVVFNNMWWVQGPGPDWNEVLAAALPASSARKLAPDSRRREAGPRFDMAGRKIPREAPSRLPPSP